MARLMGEDTIVRKRMGASGHAAGALRQLD
jgi:hypothetical protein